MITVNDRLLSVRKHLYTVFQDRIATDGMRFEVNGRINNYRRPIWNFRRINHREENLTYASYWDIDQWSFVYNSVGRQDADDALQRLQKSITAGGANKKLLGRIYAWRFNWQYPVPRITQITGGLLVPATYHIRVSGIDLCNTESAASLEMLVTLQAPNNALRIEIMREPFISSLFKSYNVYVNGRLEANVLHPSNNGGLLYPTATIAQLLGTGAAPKEVSDEQVIRWKFIRVDSFACYTREDEVDDGVFNGFVTMQTSTFQERERVQPEVMQVISGQQTVVLPPTDAITQQYNILSTNPTKVVNY